MKPTGDILRKLWLDPSILNGPDLIDASYYCARISEHILSSCAHCALSRSTVVPNSRMSAMDGVDGDGDAGVAAAGFQRDEEAEEMAELLRDRFRLSVISIADAEAKKMDMELEDPVVACVADLAFKYAEQLAKDIELFAQHAGRKSVINMEDVILSAHRNEHLMGLLRSFSQELKGKEPQTERKRKRSSKKDDKAIQS